MSPSQCLFVSRFAIATLLLLSGIAIAFGQKTPKVILPGSAPFTESFQDMIQRDQQRQNIPGAAPEIREAPSEEINGIERTIPRGNEFQALARAMPIVAAPQTIGTSFQAINLTDEFNIFSNGFIPPDTMGAIGPNHFIEIIQGAVAIYTKAGAPVGFVVTMNDFFTVGTHPSGGSADPRVFFDRRSGRFFATAIELNNGTNQNGIILAVSRTSDPTGLWDKYFVDVRHPSAFNDYPTLGTDDNGVYFGTTTFPGGAAEIAATPKASLIAASPSLSTVTQFTGITDMYSSPQPALNFDSTSGGGPQFFVSSSTTVFGNINYRSLTWSGGVPSLSATSVLTTAAYGDIPHGAPASGSTTNINAGDDRLLMCVLRAGKLWTARGVFVNSGGGASSADRDGCEWFELGISGTSRRVKDAALNGPLFFRWLQGHAPLDRSFAEDIFEKVIRAFEPR